VKAFFVATFLLVACNAGEDVSARTQSMTGPGTGAGDDNIATPTNAEEEGEPSQEAEEEFQLAWDGGTRPGLEVWQGPAAANADPSAVSMEFDANLQRAKDSVVVDGTIGTSSAELWESEHPGSGWGGSNVVTRVNVKVNATLCGVPTSETIPVYFRGGTAGGRTDYFGNQPRLKEGDSTILLLARGEGSEYFLRAGYFDLLKSTSPGKYHSYSKQEYSLADIQGACP